MRNSKIVPGRLHLSIYKKWFDEILSGNKKTEYRDIKPYYDKLLSKKYTEVKLVNGYGAKRPYVVVAVMKIIKSQKFYEIHLGDIIETGNI